LPRAASSKALSLAAVSFSVSDGAFTFGGMMMVFASGPAAKAGAGGKTEPRIAKRAKAAKTARKKDKIPLGNLAWLALLACFMLSVFSAENFGRGIAGRKKRRHLAIKK